MIETLANNLWVSDLWVIYLSLYLWREEFKEKHTVTSEGRTI